MKITLNRKFFLKLSRIVFLLSIAFWFAETAYFGWNATPMSEAETLCDTIVAYGIVTGILIRFEVISDYVECKIKSEQ